MEGAGRAQPGDMSRESRDSFWDHLRALALCAGWHSTVASTGRGDFCRPVPLLSGTTMQ